MKEMLKTVLLVSLLVSTATAAFAATASPAPGSSATAVERGLCASASSTLASGPVEPASGQGFAAFLTGDQPQPMAGPLGCQQWGYCAGSDNCASCHTKQDCASFTVQVCVCAPCP